MREVRWTLTRPQAEAIQSAAPYVDIEGGIRGSKSFAAHIKTLTLVTEHPGINCLLARWTDDDTFAELAPRWRAFAEQNGLRLVWNTAEGYDEIVNEPVGPNGQRSRVYLRGLRSAEITRPFAKIRGLDLAFIHIEQAEELPDGWFGELIGRLSQNGFPHALWLTPQPVNQDHWIAKLFPEHNPHPDFHYIRTNCYENRANLQAGYIEQLEAQYPPGSAQRRTLLEGRRGLAIQGEAVYSGYFNRAVHVREIEMDPHVPLVETWDFGHGHPCVVWEQFLPVGRFQILGAVMGQAMFLEDFAPVAQHYRNLWCPNPLTIWGAGDPSALESNNQGVQTTKVADILAEHGIYPVSQSHANTVEAQYNATQSIGRYMRRMALDGASAFALNPRAMLIAVEHGRVEHLPIPFVADGFEAGFVWSDRSIAGLKAGVRQAKNDGYYDHAQRACNYGVTAFEPAQPTQQTAKRAEARAIREAQRDPADPAPVGHHRRRNISIGMGGRGGY